jgi:2-polyprenyl-6-methoxyphenol hydroxylase-like FAD-dependent oxidoreductase
LPAGSHPARVSFDNGGGHEAAARLVVGADGRFSQIRSWAGFRISREPELLSIAGLLLENLAVPDDSIHLAFGKGIASLMAPLGNGRARTYFVYPSVAGRRGLSGSDKSSEFIRLCIEAGIETSWLADARVAGPLAEFEGADHWVESPVRPGVTLIGDAAAATDPSWGCGLSLTLLDVEHLGDALCSSDDWSAALNRYAREHDEYASTLRRIHSWMNQLTWSWGAEADARRARVFPRMRQDPRGFPDSIGHGPFGPSDERARRLMLGEEEASPAGTESV